MLARGGLLALVLLQLLRPSATAVACPPPGDCSLAEAAAPHGIRIGLFDSLGHPQREAIVLAEANAYTNHGFSWNVMQPEPEVWNFEAADPGYAFAQQHGLHQTGLHFAWDQQLLDDLPAWVAEIEDPGELRAALSERARVIFERYPGLNRIDVINEPLAVTSGALYANHFYQVLGPDYIAELFRLVRAQAPAHVELFINENLTEYVPAKRAALRALVRELVEAEVPIDAVGLQTHLLLPLEPNWEGYRSMMQEFAGLGLKVFLSELDVPVEIDRKDRFAWQAERYRRAVEVCVSVPACDEITVWGVDDPSTWLQWFIEPGLDPLLYDGDFQPKPAYFAFRDALLLPEPAGRSLLPAALLALGLLRAQRFAQASSGSSSAPSSSALRVGA